MKLKKYDHKLIESKWQKAWDKLGLYSGDLKKHSDKAKNFYNLWMFPYPSAEGMHVGTVFSSTGSDVYGRYQRMKGKTVFQPIGYDSFGIHSENYALKTKDHPKKLIERTTKNFKRQFKMLGHGYDWERTVTTSDIDYYRYTEWLFATLFKAGLAYKKKAEVNWCPSCKTVLADEQVMSPKQAFKDPKDANGNIVPVTENMRVCERCGTLVEKKQLSQWFFRITDYADRLLANLDKIDWSQRVKTAQREWIGKSEGRLIKFKLVGQVGELEVFTTRPDTLKGATFLVMADDELYNQKSKDKVGIFTNIYAINPLNNKQIPIWKANYVAPGYGTGVVMGVPAFDERDKEFAIKYKLEIINFDPEENSIGVDKTNYHLRDWLISRQRYWGCPIPMIYCANCAQRGISWFDTDEGKKFPKIGNWKLNIENSRQSLVGWWPEENLPVELPEIKDWQPEGTGKGPLANHPDFYKVKCPHCGGEAERETDVADTFLDSSWYFLHYPSVGSDDRSLLLRVSALRKTSRSAAAILHPFKPNITKAWLPVNLYFGGAEHSVLHLMYARFVTMALHDLKLLDFEEPFPKFFAHGLMIKDGAKMSKSRGNVVNPDEYVEKYGADTLRLYLMFMGPMDGYPDFRDTGIEGMRRFVNRVWKLLASGKTSRSASAPQNVNNALHKTIKGVTLDIENFRYNTAIAKIMELVNLLEEEKNITNETIEVLCKILAPFTPHLSEEIWQDTLGHKETIHASSWPTYDEKYLLSETLDIVIQVNGKLRGTVNVSRDEGNDQKSVSEESRKLETISKNLEGYPNIKEVFIPGRLINFVVQGDN